MHFLNEVQINNIDENHILKQDAFCLNLLKIFSVILRLIFLGMEKTSANS